MSEPVRNPPAGGTGGAGKQTGIAFSQDQEIGPVPTGTSDLTNVSGRAPQPPTNFVNGEGSANPRTASSNGVETLQEGNSSLPKNLAIRNPSPTIKLGIFNGSSSLETFLGKLSNCADYYSWSEKDKLWHLKAALEGSAAQILWQLKDGATADDIIALLRTRFGSSNQCERFRAELYARKRKRGESLQSLCNDVRRLLLLAYPDSHDVVCDVVGRDAFLAALDNPSLRTRILDQRPSSLDDALDMACRMEAYTPTNNEEPSYTDADRDRLDRRRARQVRADNRNYEENRQIKELRSQLADPQREIRQLKAEADTWRAQAEAGARPPSASVAQLTNQWASIAPSQPPCRTVLWTATWLGL